MLNTLFAAHTSLTSYLLTMASNNPLEVLQSLNWDEPIKPDDPRFVDTDEARGENIQYRLMRKLGYDPIRRQLFASAKKHVLLFGPIGCGKSTELLRLHATLRTTWKLYPVTLNLRNEVDINNLQYADMLMALATAVVQELATQNISVPKKELAQLGNWFKEHVATEEGIKELSAEITSEISAELGIPFLAKLMSKVTAKFKNSSSYKDTLRNVIRNSFTQFVVMRQILAGRIDLAVFQEPASIEKLIEYSGGHPRELLRLLGLACELTDDERISDATLERAADKLADEFRYWLAPDDYAFLAATDHTNGVIEGMDGRSSNLLWRLALLQYNNGSWRLSHPLVRRLAEYKKALALVTVAATAAAATAASAAV